MKREEKLDWLCRLRSELDVWMPEKYKYKRMYKEVLTEEIKGLGQMSKGGLNVDKAIWEIYENISHLLCEQPYGKYGRYITYYAEERLYLVFDLWYHGFFLVEANSPKDAIGEVNCDRLKYVLKVKE